MRDTIKPALVIFAFFTLLTGLVYPFFITGVAQLAFPYQANGSLLYRADGQIAGSTLIGQAFDAPQYFWGRLSATPGSAYNAAASGASNYSVLNNHLTQQAQQRVQTLRAADPENQLPVPMGLVTASASGLDPHISPAAAYFQAARVARYRGISTTQVHNLINKYTEEPLFGLIGEPRVNVLLLNMALDSLQ